MIKTLMYLYRLGQHLRKAGVVVIIYPDNGDVKLNAKDANKLLKPDDWKEARYE